MSAAVVRLGIAAGVVLFIAIAQPAALALGVVALGAEAVANRGQ